MVNASVTQGFGLGGTVVKDLAADTVVKNANHHIYIDNYFTSLRLLQELAQNGIFCTGTIQRNRVEGAPLKDLRKAARGTYDALQGQTPPGPQVSLSA